MARQSAPFSKDILDEMAGEILPQNIHDLWTEYVTMRNRIAKTRIETDQSQKRIFRQLLNFSQDNDKREFSLEQSIDMKYRGFFEPKHDYLLQYKKRKNSRKKPEKKIPEKISEKIPGISEKKSIRDIVRKQAAQGVQSAIELVRRWDNPEIAAREKKIKEVRKERDLEIKCSEDAAKGIGKGGFSGIN